MLRMGRNPKAEPNEQEQQPAAAPQYPAYNAPAQPVAPPAYYNPEPPARPETQSPQATRAVTETESLAREIKDGTMSGFVGSGTVLSGEANFKGMLRVDGHLTGRITSEKGTLIVSSGGRVDADIQVATAKINGIINGDIIATERLEFGRTAQVHGNIQTPVITIEQGAIFEGSCRMSASKAESKITQTEKPRVAESVTRSSNSSVPPPAASKSATPEVAKASNVVS